MARARSPDRDKAFEIYKEQENITNREIGKILNVSEKTISGWKCKDCWNEKINGVLPKKQRSTPNKKVIPKKKKVTETEREELTEKQRLFCLYYIKNFNATLAYLKAYGGSYDVANVEGYRTLVKPSIKNEVERLKKIKNQSIMISEEDIVERYMRIAFSDMTDFAEFGTKEVPDYDGEGKQRVDNEGNPVYRKCDFVDFKNHDQVDGGLISEISVGKSGMKVKLQDQQKALKWLSDYFVMNPLSQHKIEYDNEMLSLQKKKSGDGSNVIEESNKKIASLADLLNSPVVDRHVQDFEEEEQ